MLAAYSEHREHNLEMKYLRKRLSEVDAHIVLPDSLKGEALLARLDGVEQQAPPMSVTLMRPRRWFNARSGFAYAAAFLLIVGLFYGLGFDKQSNLIDGTITLDREQGRSIESRLEVEETSPASVPEAAARAALPAAEQSGEPEANNSKAADMAPFAALSGPSASTSKEAEDRNVPDAMGGVLSTQLCTFGEDYVLACRPVDENDPHIDAANVLEVLNHRENRLVALVPLPAMDRVLKAFAGDHLVAVVGEDDHSVYTLTLDLSDLEEPKTLELLEQPGALAAARVFERVAHLVSYTSEPLEGEFHAVELPHSSETGAAVFTALSLEDGSRNQVTFLGAGKEIKLYNISAYVYFDGVSLENEVETSDLFVAQIKFNDLEIELAGVS